MFLYSYSPPPSHHSLSIFLLSLYHTLPISISLPPFFSPYLLLFTLHITLSPLPSFLTRSHSQFNLSLPLNTHHIVIFSLFPIWCRHIKFSISTFSGLALLPLLLHVFSYNHSTSVSVFLSPGVHHRLSYFLTYVCSKHTPTQPISPVALWRSPRLRIHRRR